MAKWTAKTNNIDKIDASHINTLQTLKADMKKAAAASLGTLDIGEFGWAIDTEEMYIGTSTGNKKISDHGLLTGLTDIDHLWSATKTTATWSKTIGPGGDYATWAAMYADIPDLIGHDITITIKKGTILTENCPFRNKRRIKEDETVYINPEKYYPTSGILPTADGGGNNGVDSFLTDAHITVDDEYNDCWCHINDGTGKNQLLKIKDTVAAENRIYFDGLAAIDPDNTSRYIIYGALIDGTGFSQCLDIDGNGVLIYVKGIGVINSAQWGIYVTGNSESVILKYSGAYNCARSGIAFIANSRPGRADYCGVTGCNTGNHADEGGISCDGSIHNYIRYSGISDNLRRGVYIHSEGYVELATLFGADNGTWGVEVSMGGAMNYAGTLCSGSSGTFNAYKKMYGYFDCEVMSIPRIGSYEPEPTSSPAVKAQMWVQRINAEVGKCGLHTRPENAPTGVGNKHIIGACLIKTDTGDPTYSHEFMFCINTFDNNLKVYAGGGWRQIASW